MFTRADDSVGSAQEPLASESAASRGESRCARFFRSNTPIASAARAIDFLRTGKLPCVQPSWTSSELWFFETARLEFTDAAKLCFAQKADGYRGLFSS